MTDSALSQIEDIDVDINAQEVLLAASQHDIPRLRQLIRSNETRDNLANAKDPETGYTPLHAAIAACEPDAEAEDERSKKTNGELGVTDAALDVTEAAQETVKFLLQEGAIWNDLDANDETPGCLARRLGLSKLYELMVDAGVRAELLLNRLDEYEPLVDEDEEQDGEGEQDAPNGVNDGDATTQTHEQQNVEQSQHNADEDAVTNSRYLQSNLSFEDHRLLDEDKNGVMMSWETEIMAKSAKALLPTAGLRILNIGHGMGIVDGLIQDLQPSFHHIVEAHPSVLAEMKSKGWYEKSGVVVHEGKWQDILPKLIDEGVTFDAIYYDTFAESYADFRRFFSEHVIGLLEPGGRWSFFNGMGADRQISYDVYQKVVEIDLLEAGFDVEWEDIKIPSLENEWTGVRRKYWVVDNYRLPVCKYMD
ncbi:hypothetical protein VTO42DRAFT_8639 [Malbranchea cinnamomea]